jgi:hypothetical protein
VRVCARAFANNSARARLQRALELGRAVAMGVLIEALTRVNRLDIENTDGPNLKESVTRRGKDGEKEEGVVGGLDLVGWFYVAGMAARYQWGSLDVR